MRKNWIAVTALMMILIMLCAACSGSENDKAETDAAATDIPTVTAPPAGESGEQLGLAAENNSAPEGMTREEWLATLSEDQRKAEELVGNTVDVLFKSIGEPKSAEYTTSCLVADGQDGILTYDGFYVSTTRFANGVEYVMGTVTE